MPFAFPSGQPQLPAYDQGLSPQDIANIEGFRSSWYGGPDFKGRGETGQFLSGYLGNLYRQWANEAPVDYSGAAQIGRLYGNRDQALNARLGAMGISGGAAAGANARLQGAEGSSVADYYGAQNRMRQAQHQAQLQQFNNLYAQLGMQGLQSNIQAQYNKGGWLKDLLSIGGDVLGKVTGGVNPLGFLSKGGGGAVPYTGSDPYGQQAGASVGTIDPGYYGPWPNQQQGYGSNL